jgi:hypothetical protein
MRRLAFLGFCAGLLAGACSSADRTTAASHSPYTPSFASTGGIPDLDGVPDLTVDAKKLDHSWLIRDEDATQCSVVEGGVSPGTHRMLRFTATTPNIGTADVFIGDPLEHVAANDGMFEFALCHDHYHFRHYANYELISLATGEVVQAAKRGFCMVDVSQASGGPPGKKRTYDTCGNRSAPGFQGISVGWADSYDRVLDGQFFVLDEPAATVVPGDYVLRITVNPPFTCGTGDDARPRDANGLCHMFAESDYANNVGETIVTVPSDVKRATGPGLLEAHTPEELAAIKTKTTM